MSVKVAFYKAKGTLFDALVRWVTQSPYSHCELVIDGVAYSSSGRDHGVRAKNIAWNPEHWDFLELDEAVPEAKKALAKAWFEVHLGESYDWFGLIWFVIPLPWEKRRRWFCSEACAEALGMSRSWAYSPQTLYASLRKLASTLRHSEDVIAELTVPATA